jgi:murein DD-endopeptidase MepM/ murein hydrolase activator NlpD
VRPTEGAVTIPFSGDELVFQPTFGDWRVHAGTDYAGDEGDRVYAVADGTVERVWTDSLNGQCVELAHADGLNTIYMGLKENPKAKEGGTVKAGDVIGSIGATNEAESAQGAHLHLEARVGDRAVDIETFLTGTEGE